jgi:hypothetical protein
MDDNPATLPDQHCSKAGKGPKTKRVLKSAKIALVRFDERDDPGFLDWVREKVSILHEYGDPHRVRTALQDFAKVRELLITK